MADADPIAAQLEARIAELREELARLEMALAVIRGVVDNENQSDNVSNMMPACERIKHGRKSKSSANVRRLRAACNLKNMSIRDLAKKARQKTGYKRASQALLSLAADGLRPIDQALTDWIASEVDYPATVDNWPKLRAR